MSDEEKTPNELLLDYLNIYLAPRNRDYRGDELEIKFVLNIIIKLQRQILIILFKN